MPEKELQDALQSQSYTNRPEQRSPHMQAKIVYTKRSNITEEHTSDPEQTGLERKLPAALREALTQVVPAFDKGILP